MTHRLVGLTSRAPDDACCGGYTGPWDFYYPDPPRLAGTGMEHFGDRLSFDYIWRVRPPLHQTIP